MSERNGRGQEALIALRQIIRATELSARRLAKSTGLTNSQLVVLQVLAREGEVTPSFISAQVGLTQATVTALIQRLIERGFVQRRRGQADKRQVWIELTPCGRSVLTDMPSTLTGVFLDQFVKLEDWEQGMLVAALERTAAMLDANHIRAAPVLEMSDMIELAGRPEDSREAQPAS